MAGKIILYTKTKKFELNKRIPLNKILIQLACDNFVHCHQCGIINIAKVKIIGRDMIELHNTQSVVLTKKYKKHFLESFSKYKWRNEL